MLVLLFSFGAVINPRFSIASGSFDLLFVHGIYASKDAKARPKCGSIMCPVFPLRPRQIRQQCSVKGHSGTGDENRKGKITHLYPALPTR